jgi:hypothetical protein
VEPKGAPTTTQTSRKANKQKPNKLNMNFADMHFIRIPKV